MLATTVVLFVNHFKNLHKNIHVFYPTISLTKTALFFFTKTKPKQEIAKPEAPTTFLPCVFFEKRPSPINFPSHNVPPAVPTLPSRAPSFALEAAHVEGDTLPSPSCQQTPPGSMVFDRSVGFGFPTNLEVTLATDGDRKSPNSLGLWLWDPLQMTGYVYGL